MAQMSRTWWGSRFLHALESFTDSGRLQRGKSYAGPNRILDFGIQDGIIYAQIRGNANPYFGVYKEPKYNTQISLAPISDKKWSKIIAHLSTKASTVSRLMLNEMPETIEESFIEMGQHLLPSSRKDFTTHCSCPDSSNPCKHIAGLYYRFAQELDQDPFLLFELRGLSRDQLQIELAKTPLGKALALELVQQDLPPDPVESYFTRPISDTPPSVVALRDYWHGSKRLPPTVEAELTPGLPAILIKKMGEDPPFWQKDSSFTEVMVEFYERVRTKNKDLL